ncbi:hypothetical protein [Streptomyces sp. NPDC048496]|uniref:hypothetical protein n=1 Tax=Streptomyces sp. NPDC048496 TaxID=3365558 RepID=UPI003721FE41
MSKAITGNPYAPTVNTIHELRSWRALRDATVADADADADAESAGAVPPRPIVERTARGEAVTCSRRRPVTLESDVVRERTRFFVGPGTAGRAEVIRRESE